MLPGWTGKVHEGFSPVVATYVTYVTYVKSFAMASSGWYGW